MRRTDGRGRTCAMPNFLSHYYHLLFFSTHFPLSGGGGNDLSLPPIPGYYSLVSLLHLARYLSLLSPMIDMRRDRPIWPSCGRFREGGRPESPFPPFTASPLRASRGPNANVTPSRHRPRDLDRRRSGEQVVGGRKCLPRREPAFLKKNSPFLLARRGAHLQVQVGVILVRRPRAHLGGEGGRVRQRRGGGRLIQRLPEEKEDKGERREGRKGKILARGGSALPPIPPPPPPSAISMR